MENPFDVNVAAIAAEITSSDITEPLPANSAVEDIPGFTEAAPAAAPKAPKKEMKPKIDVDFKIAPNKNSIDLWDKDVDVIPMEVRTDTFKLNGKVVGIALPNPEVEISPEIIAAIKVILTQLKKKEFKVRFICNHVQQLHSTIADIFDEADITRITPWKVYCKLPKAFLESHVMTIPSDRNVMAASYHSRNFNDMHPVGKLFKTANINVLLGDKNDDPLSFMITYDSKFPKQGAKDASGNWVKVDYKHSRDNSGYPYFAKTFGIPFINLADADDRSSLIGSIKD